MKNKKNGGERLNMKVLLILALTLFTVVSTVATVAIAFNISTPKTFSITKSMTETIGFRGVQPAGGDPVEDPIAPD